jgi:hypothetical protein
MDGVLQFLFSFIFDNRQTLEKKYFPLRKIQICFLGLYAENF